MTQFIDYEKFSLSYRMCLASVIPDIEPTWYLEEVSKLKWQDTMHQEIDALEKNGLRN